MECRRHSARPVLRIRVRLGHFTLTVLRRLECVTAPHRDVMAEIVAGYEGGEAATHAPEAEYPDDRQSWTVVLDDEQLHAEEGAPGP